MNKKLAFFPAVLAVGLLAAVPMRTSLTLNDIDPKTGFYTGGGPLIVAVNLVLLLVTLLLILPLFRNSFRVARGELSKSTAAGAVACVLAAAFFIDALHEFYLLMLKSGGASDFFNSLLEFGATGFFAMVAAARFRGGKIEFPLGALLPVVWATFHLMAAFMRYTTVVNISEYLYDMLRMVFVMLFYYYYARYTGRVSNGNETKGMLAFGLPAVFFSLVSTLPRYIASLSGKNFTLSPSEDFLFLVISAQILFTLWEVYHSKSAPAGPERPAET